MKRLVAQTKKLGFKKNNGDHDAESKQRSRWSLEKRNSHSSRSSLDSLSFERSQTSPSLDMMRSSLERLQNPFEDQTYIAKMITKVKRGNATIVELLDELMSLSNVMSIETHYKLCDLLAQENNLEYLLLLLTGRAEVDESVPANAEESPREIYRYSWISATLISCGPKELREPIATRPRLVSILVDFLVTADTTEEVRISRVVRVISSVLHMMPILNVLANRFEASSSSEASSSLWNDSVQENIPEVMVNISIRAMMIPGYNNRETVSLRSFNLDVRKLDLLCSPTPFIRVFQRALDKCESGDGTFPLCAALTAMSGLLEILRLGRDSDSVTVLRQVRMLDSLALEYALCGFLDTLLPFLDTDSEVSTRLCVDVMQFIVKLLRVGSKGTVMEICRRGGLSKILDLFFYHENNDIIHRLTRDAIQCSMEKNNFDLQMYWLRDTPIILRVLEKWDALDLDQVMRGAAEVADGPSYAGDVIDISICLRTFFRRTVQNEQQYKDVLGEAVYARFRNLCDNRLPNVEKYRKPQVTRHKKNRSPLFPVIGGSEPDLGEGDGDRIYYQSLVEHLLAEQRGEESAWSPLLEFVRDSATQLTTNQR